MTTHEMIRELALAIENLGPSIPTTALKRARKVLAALESKQSQEKVVPRHVCPITEVYGPAKEQPQRVVTKQVKPWCGSCHDDSYACDCGANEPGYDSMGAWVEPQQAEEPKQLACGQAPLSSTPASAAASSGLGSSLSPARSGTRPDAASTDLVTEPVDGSAHRDPNGSAPPKERTETAGENPAAGDQSAEVLSEKQLESALWSMLEADCDGLPLERRLGRVLMHDKELRRQVRELIRHENETRAALRDACDLIGDNDWPDNLHLADVVEKHLLRPADREIEALETERDKLKEQLAEARRFLDSLLKDKLGLSETAPAQGGE